MTVVVGVKVADGIVIAADSAASFPLVPQLGRASDQQVYYHADKVFQLHRDLPIGLACWGAAYIGTGSISSLAKDLRRRIMGLDRDFPGWKLDKRRYQMSDVAEAVIKFFYDELFVKTEKGTQGPTGLFLAGYSASSRHGQAWEITLEDHTVRPVPEVVFDEGTFGWKVWGQPMATSRLIEGIGPGLKDQIMAMLTDGRRMILASWLEQMGGPKVVPAMPLIDAIKFAQFCADVTVGYNRFDPGADTVGGPIDVAAISRHESFRWVQRKHYYPVELNPRRPHDHDKRVGRGDDDVERLPEDGGDSGTASEGVGVEDGAAG